MMVVTSCRFFRVNLVLLAAFTIKGMSGGQSSKGLRGGSEGVRSSATTSSHRTEDAPRASGKPARESRPSWHQFGPISRERRRAVVVFAVIIPGHIAYPLGGEVSDDRPGGG